MSIYCIGDVHGCIRSLEALLTKINYHESSDEVWFTGDLVNRGPDSIAVLNLVRSLPNAVVVLGNHELITMACYFDRQLLTRLKHPDDMQRLLEHPSAEEHMAWLLQRPLLYQTILPSGQKALVVHAGIYPWWSFDEVQRYATEVSNTLQQHPSSLIELFTTHKAAVMPLDLSDKMRFNFINRVLVGMRYCHEDGALDFTTVAPPELNTNTQLKPWFEFKRQEIEDAYQIFFGHWAALGARRCTSSIVCVDSGCSWGRSLTAIDVERGTFTSVPCQDECTKQNLY